MIINLLGLFFHAQDDDLKLKLLSVCFQVVLNSSGLMTISDSCAKLFWQAKHVNYRKSV